MAKTPFHTRLDDAVLRAARRIAEDEHRTVTNVIEVAVLAYAERASSPENPAATEQNTAP